MSKVRVNILKCGITTVLAGLVSFLLIHQRYPGADAPAAEKYRVLCDAFTVPGVLLLAVGALIYVSSEGIFLGIGWAVKNGLYLLIPGKALDRESYKEYRARKTGEKKATGYGFLFVVGLLFLIVGIVFLLLYNSAS